MAYYGYITTLKDVRKHENADKLQVATVFGNDVVIGLDMKIGDKVLYLPTDGQLDYDFAKANNLLRIKDENGKNIGYLDPDKRNIKSIRLRGEKSDGIIMKIDSLSPYTDVGKLKDGDKIDTLNGVLLFQKYIPKAKSKQDTTIKTKKEKKKILFPFFEQHADTQQLAYNLRSFKEGDLCYITLKMHGTSGRTGHLQKKEPNNWLRKMLRMKTKKSWDFVSGTRRVVLDSFNQEGYYGDNNFRKQWHDLLAEKLPKSCECFYEIVGYTDDGKLIMPEVSNKKLNDKEFVKQYGETTQFTYGCGYGQSEMYIYRMTYTNEDGEVIEIPFEHVMNFCEMNGLNHVPLLDKFIFTTEEDLIERVHKYEDGQDPIGKTHVREGVVVRVENKNPKFQAYKQKNFSFKVLEGIIKDDGVLDIEEEQSLVESDSID